MYGEGMLYLWFFILVLTSTFTTMWIINKLYPYPRKCKSCSYLYYTQCRAKKNMKLIVPNTDLNIINQYVYLRKPKDINKDNTCKWWSDAYSY